MAKLKNIGYYQEGGAMPAGDPAAAQAQGGGDPMQQILQAAAQAVQAGDCQIALQVCQVLVQMAGGGAPSGAAPAEAQMARRGGRLMGRPSEPVYDINNTKMLYRNR